MNRLLRVKDELGKLKKTKGVDAIYDFVKDVESELGSNTV